MDLRMIYSCFVFQVLAVTFSTIATTTGYDTSNAFVERLQRRNYKKFYDDVTGVTAIKDASSQKCYIRSPLQDKHTEGLRIVQSYIAPDELLFLAGERIFKFCTGYPSFIITIRNPNESPAKSNIKKRSTQHYFTGHRRGQTQSQYLNFGSSNEPGKAEAEFTAEGSRAVVTGSNGMGQAQSQSGVSDCGDCRRQDQTLHYTPHGATDIGAEIYVPGSLNGAYPQAEIRRPGGGTQLVHGPSGPGPYQQQPNGSFGTSPLHRPSAGADYNGKLIPGQGSTSLGPKRYPLIQPSGSNGLPTQQGTGTGQVQPGIYGSQQRPGGVDSTTGGQYPRISETQPVPVRPGYISGGLPSAQAELSAGPAGPSGPPFTSERLPSVQPGVSVSQQQQPGGLVPSGGRFPVVQQSRPTQFTGVTGPGTSQQNGEANIGQLPLTGSGQYPQSVAGVQRPSGFITTQPGITQFPTQIGVQTPSQQFPTQISGGGSSGQPQTQIGVGDTSGQIPTQTGQFGVFQPGVQTGQFNGRAPTNQQFPAGSTANGVGGRLPVTVQSQGRGTQQGQFAGQFAGNYVPDSGQTGRFSGTFAGQYDSPLGYNGPYDGTQQIGTPQSGLQGSSAAVVPSSGSQFIQSAQDRQPVSGTANGQQGTQGQFAPGTQIISNYPEQIYTPDQARTQGGVGTGGIVQQNGGITRPGQITTGPTYGAYGPSGAVQTITRPDQTANGDQYIPGYGPAGPSLVSGTGTIPGSQITEGGYVPGQYAQTPEYRPTGSVQFQPNTGSAQQGAQFGAGPLNSQLGESINGVIYNPSGVGQPTQFGQPQGAAQIGTSDAQYSPGTTQFVPSGGTTQYVPAAGNGQYLSNVGDGIQYGPGAVGPQQFPDQRPYAPGQVQQFGPNAQVTKQDQTYQGAGGYEVNGGIVDDDSDSEAQSSVQQINNETQASASAQGKFGGGTAQSQVQGSYFGTGSFTASAGTNDGRRGAQTQISGGDTGVMSTAQGSGGLGQSQAQVLLSSDTGETTSNAQSSGYNHGTNSQVQANEKGGMADAQANGQGSTSSQAQIGFTPYNENDTDDQESPFRGGGTASAQGGTYSGQSQSQISGKFHFGIKYTGSAQAQSGGNSSSAPGNQTSFKPFTPFSFPNITRQTHSNDRQNFSATRLNKNLKQPSSTTLRYESNETKLSQQTTTEAEHEPEYYDENDYGDYEDEEKHKIGTKSIVQNSGNQKQHIILDPLEDLDATVHQTRGNDELQHGAVFQPGQRIPGSSGYRIPQGFRGKVISFANGANTAAFGPNSQAQSVTLKPGSGKIIYTKPLYQLGSRTHLYNGNYGYGSGYTYQPVTYRLKSGKSLPNFVAITKSETGSQDLYTGKKTPSVYYTQSSTCGYFTNTCVFNGKTKICSPKPKTNPDGSPVICR